MGIVYILHILLCLVNLRVECGAVGAGNWVRHTGLRLNNMQTEQERVRPEGREMIGEVLGNITTNKIGRPW